MRRLSSRHRAVAALFTLSLIISCGARAEKSATMSLTLHEKSMDVVIRFPASGVREWDAYVRPAYGPGVGSFPDAFRNIEATGGDGSVEKYPSLPADGRSLWIDRSGHEYSISYTVACSRPPTFSGTKDALFYPSIYPDWACMWGFAYLLAPDDVAFKKVKVSITSDHFTDIVTTFPRGVPITFWDLRKSLILAGNFRRSQIQFDGLELNFFGQGEFAANDSTFIAIIQKLISAQKSYFGHYPYAQVNAILRPGSADYSGGKVTSHGLFLHPDPKQPIPNSALVEAIAEGHYLLWDTLLPTEFEKAMGYFDWFPNGFAKYYGVMTPFREGLMDSDTAVAFLNKYLAGYAVQPASFSVRAADLGDYYWTDENLRELPEFKGFGIGLILDMAIRSATSESKSLDHFVCELLTVAQKKNSRELNDVDFIKALESITGQKWKDKYKALVLGVEPLPLREALSAYGFTVAEEEKGIFDLGFSLRGSIFDREREVLAVTDSSNAAKAGLVVGDTLVSFSYVRDKPNVMAHLSVRRNGTPMQIEFLPIGRRTIFKIVPDSASSAALARLAIHPAVPNQ